MFSRLVAAEIEREDGEMESLDDFEIAGFATLLGGGAGAETVTKLVGNAAVTFARFPDQWQKLLEDRSKIPAAVEELLRYEPPVHYNVRRSMREVQLHGVTIPPEGKPVFLLGGSAHRDPEAFTDPPDAFDIDRDRTEAQNLGFGYGVHSCLGGGAGPDGDRDRAGQTARHHAALRGALGRMPAGGDAERRGLVPRPGAGDGLTRAIRVRARRISCRLVLGTHDRRDRITGA